MIFGEKKSIISFGKDYKALESKRRGRRMLNWVNTDKLASYQELFELKKVNLAQAMAGENGAERVKIPAVV